MRRPVFAGARDLVTTGTCLPCRAASRRAGDRALRPPRADGGCGRALLRGRRERRGAPVDGDALRMQLAEMAEIHDGKQTTRQISKEKVQVHNCVSDSILITVSPRACSGGYCPHRLRLVLILKRLDQQHSCGNVRFW